MHPENPFYNYTESYLLNGQLNIRHLSEALQYVYDAHDILRTTYVERDGVPYAKISPKTEVPFTVFDFSIENGKAGNAALEKVLLHDARKPFDLKNGPVVRFSLYKLATEKHILLLNLHHIATDKWSMGVFRRHLSATYRELSEGQTVKPIELPIQYHDYAAWQRKRKADAEQIDYWKGKLSGSIPVLELPHDLKKVSVPSYKGAFEISKLPASLAKNVLDLAAAWNTTAYVFLLSAYYVLLYRHSRQKDISIGSPISNRDYQSLEDLVGFFNNTVVLRTQLEPSMSFKKLVQEVRKTSLGAFANKNVPFEELVKELKLERSLSANPFFNVMFLYHAVPEKPDFGPEITFSQSVFDTKVTKFDLTLYVAEEAQNLTTIFEYATDYFEHKTVKRFQKHFEHILTDVLKNPDKPISGISMLTPDEISFFLEGNRTSETKESKYHAIHDLMADIARKNSTSTAVIFGGHSIDYATLDQRATTVAQGLLSLNIREKKAIGLCMDRSIDLIVGLLGILKAGCAYVPLDPEYPQERIDFMLEDAGISYVLGDTNSVTTLNPKGAEVLDISILEKSTEVTNKELPKVHKDDLAYIIYTSGSSGKPKGVPISHANILSSTLGRFDFYDENPDVFLLLSSVAFDSSKAGIFWTLCSGGALNISQKRLEQDISLLADIIKKNKVSHTLMLPSLYSLLLEHADNDALKSLKSVIVAGEACPSPLSMAHFEKLPQVRLYNEYGPTEATVWCLAHQIVPDDIGGSIPIGKPVAGAKVYLLDEYQNFVPFGAIGELYIGGPGLSGSYLNRKDLTNAAYLENPHQREYRELLYRTGDLGRFKNDGSLEFMGRADQQIKIRGFRVELGEIENALLQHDNVVQAAVVVQQTLSAAPKRLIAFVVASTDLTVLELKEYLGTFLPDYMVPAQIHLQDELPILPNGKVDKIALANSRPLEKETESTHKAPKNRVESDLQRIWQEVLGIKDVGTNDNFFKIGGDSISSIQIVAKARKVGILLKPNEIFDHQTIEELALFAKMDTVLEISEEIVAGKVPLTPIQHWFFESHIEAPHFWNQGAIFHQLKTDDPSVIQEVVHEIVAYHDALRSTFTNLDGSWQCVISANAHDNVFEQLDLNDHDSVESQDQAIESFLESRQHQCDLSEARLFRALFFDCFGLQANKLFFIAHHLVIDMVSWNTIIEDFMSGIEQKLKGNPIHFKPKTTSIATWSNQLVAYSNSPDLKSEIEFWREQRPIKKESGQYQIFEEQYIKTYMQRFDKSFTDMLLKDANVMFNTKVEDLLIAALVKTMSDAMNSEHLCLELERHGRNETSSNIDVSNTVGWFTSFFPVLLKYEKQGLDAHIKSIKEQLRAIPNNGIGYGVLKYLANEDLGHTTSDGSQIVFNYLGVQSTPKHGEAPLFDFLWKGTRHPKSERNYGLEINTLVNNGHLTAIWSFATQQYEVSKLNSLARDFENHLREIVDFCCATNERNYTPSDFPEADLSQDELDNLMKRLEQD